MPVGLGAAIYLSEYARPERAQVLKPTLEILAGIPSVVLGFFALTFISPEIVQRFFSADATSFNLLAAGIGVGHPHRSRSSRRCPRTPCGRCPNSLREASLRHGRPQDHDHASGSWCPAAVSGLVAAFILAVSRAIGETMVVFIAGGAARRLAVQHRPVRARASR